MNTLLWIIAGVLALLFLAAGAAKATTPRAKLQDNMGWVAHSTDGQVKLIGILEVLGAIGLILPAALGAIGLILPAALDIAPVLVPIAATGLAITMIGAIVVHRRIKDPAAAMVPPFVLGALLIFLAIMRFGPEAF